jgi:hypothetical protein
MAGARIAKVTAVRGLFNVLVRRREDEPVSGRVRERGLAKKPDQMAMAAASPS